MKKIFISLALLFIFSVASCSSLRRPYMPEDCSYNGSTTLYDAGADKWYFTDKDDAAIETLPASTFKIIHSLIALEEGVVADQTEKFVWDGKQRTIGTPPQIMGKWNQDTNLQMAFKNSTVWFYEEIEQQIARTRYRKYLTKNNYGNGQLGQPGNFWVHGDYSVSPINQIEFLRTLESGTAFFSKRTIEIVKNIMCHEEVNEDKLCVKTGWTDDRDLNIGWYVGWFEKGGQRIFFASRLKERTVDDLPKFLACRKLVTSSFFKSQVGFELP